MSAETELRAALAELVACKDLKDEELRLRQRRECSIRKDPSALAKVNAMRDEYNVRAPRAWAAARALMKPAESVVSDPCPGCRRGVVCRRPTCGRLALPVDHPLRKACS